MQTIAGTVLRKKSLTSATLQSCADAVEGRGDDVVMLTADWCNCLTSVLWVSLSLSFCSF